MTEAQRLGPETSVADWLDALASPAVVPAGGSAAAIAAGLAAALAAMVARLTLAREKLAAVHPEASETAASADRLRQSLLELAVADIHAFDAVRTANRLPRTTPEETAARTIAQQAALREAARVQLDLLAQTGEVARLNLSLMQRGFAPAKGDAATGVFLAAGVARSAYGAIVANLDGDTSAEAEMMRASALEQLQAIVRVEGAADGR